MIDGHGIYGREIALKVSQRLKTLVESEMEKTILFGEERLDLHKQYPKQQEFEKAINKAFDLMELEIDEMIENGRYSGCTCSSALIYGNKVYIANIGDSRTIMVKKKLDKHK